MRANACETRIWCSLGASVEAVRYISGVDRPRISPDTRRWVLTWREAASALADVKRAELALVDTAETLRQLADAFDAALSNRLPTSTSGLIEQQAVFQRLRR